jgi:hypothetical protein
MCAEFLRQPAGNLAAAGRIAKAGARRVFAPRGSLQFSGPSMGSRAAARTPEPSSEATWPRSADNGRPQSVCRSQTKSRPSAATIQTSNVASSLQQLLGVDDLKRETECRAGFARCSVRIAPSRGLSAAAHVFHFSQIVGRPISNPTSKLNCCTSRNNRTRRHFRT